MHALPCRNSCLLGFIPNKLLFLFPPDSVKSHSCVALTVGELPFTRTRNTTTYKKKTTYGTVYIKPSSFPANTQIIFIPLRNIHFWLICLTRVFESMIASFILKLKELHDIRSVFLPCDWFLQVINSITVKIIVSSVLYRSF